MNPSADQIVLLAILLTALGLFLWGRWRYDVVALASLIAAVLAGVIPAEGAFGGFSDQAVITVAAVLVIGRTLARSGLIDLLAGRLTAATRVPQLHLTLLCGGLADLALAGWRFLPTAALEQPAAPGAFDVVDYVTELRVAAAVAAAGLDAGRLAAETGHDVHGVVREGRRLFGHALAAWLQAGDILLVETDTAGLQRLVEERGFALTARPSGAAATALELIEAVVLPNAPVQGSSALSIDLRARYGLSLVAVARQGRRFEGRLRDATLATGDALLVEGEAGRAQDSLRELGCLPLAPPASACGPGRPRCRSPCSPWRSPWRRAA